MADDISGLNLWIERRSKQEAMTVAKAVVRETKKRLVPGYGYRTGKLKRGYTAIVTPFGGAVVQKNPLRRKIWMYVEFGTRKMKARPHIRPAMEVVKARRRRAK